MCVHKFWIFDVCGHSVASDEVVRRCEQRGGGLCGKRNVKGKQRNREEVGAALAGVERSIDKTSAERKTYQGGKGARVKDAKHARSQSPDPKNESHPQLSLDPQPSYPAPAPSADTNDSLSSPCPNMTFHPFRSYKIHKLCQPCTNKRTYLISAVESGNEMRFDGWRWKVKYIPPVSENSRFADPSISGQTHNDKDTDQGSTMKMPMGEWTAIMRSWVKGAGKGLGIDLGFEDEDEEERGSARSKGFGGGEVISAMAHAKGKDGDGDGGKKDSKRQSASSQGPRQKKERRRRARRVTE